MSKADDRVSVGAAARAALFYGTTVPMVNGTGDPAKAWPKGQPPAMAGKAAEVVADKRRRDAEMVADGSARPGQVAGAPKAARS